MTTNIKINIMKYTKSVQQKSLKRGLLVKLSHWQINAMIDENIIKAIWSRNVIKMRTYARCINETFDVDMISDNEHMDLDAYLTVENMELDEIDDITSLFAKLDISNSSN